MNDRFDKLSTAVSLTVLEIDRYPNELIPAFLLANLMSPSLWAWRKEKKATDVNGEVYSAKNRLNQIQRFFHRYTFTNIEGEPGGDPWGLLNFAEEEARFGREFVENIRAEYDATFKKLLVKSPDSQFGQIINEQYYKDGFFPRLKNETLEVMNAFAAVNEEGKHSGKCIGLGMLWAAALVVWGRFPLDRIVITGNRAHMFVFLNDAEGGHLLNNTKWFSTTRINNQSELSEFTRVVASSTETTFVYNPELGMCHCTSRRSQIPRQYITDIVANIGGFVSSPLKHPGSELLQFIEPAFQIPNPLEHASAESYQETIAALAGEHADSIYDFGMYAFRSLNVRHPQVYARAAIRDYNVKQLALELRELPDALSIVSGIRGRDSIFGSRERIAMPDETLYFQIGNDRDRALLLYALLQGSPICDKNSVIGLSSENSFVSHKGQWIDAIDLSKMENEPANLEMIFNGLSGSRL